MATFPLNHNTQGWDSAHYSVTAEDPAIKTEMEGGYMVSRPRHTRTPRKTFSIGWKSMSNTDKQSLESFWNSHSGGSLSFLWVDPDRNTTYTVRFKTAPKFDYVGKGNLKLWNCTVELEQV